MNLVGKIFVGLICFLSVAFMAFSMSLYATHQNWRDVVMLSKDQAQAQNKPLGLKYQLEEEKKGNEGLKAEKANLQKELQTEKDARTQAVAKLENELRILTEEHQKREQQYADLVKSERDAVAAMKTTQDSLTHSEKERDEVAAQVLQAQQDRDNHFKEAVRVTDELHQATLEKEQLQKRLTTLAADLAKAKDALRYFDINENSDYKSKTPPRIDAIIASIAGGGLVEISAGSDDGLRVGHQLEVYRTGGGANVYVGRIEVVKITPDKAVCKINPKFQNSNMMRGDRVASKIE
jgi:hypothetical protein